MTSDQQVPSRTWPLFPPEVEVPEEDPFAQDRLGRKAEAEQLTTLLEHSPTPLVLGLDAAWGTGKTTFVKMWRRHLEKVGFKTIYFNAWDTDFISEPLIALVGEVGCLLPAKPVVAKRLKTATSLLLRKATPIAVRLLTAGLIDIKAEDFRALDAEELEKALTETAEKVIEGAIEQYQQHKNEVAEFRKALIQAVDAASADGRPLVFFIDELDRCRPTFAVELLERIKHLFEVPGAMFVLSVHREQLAHSLRAIYGHDFDAEGYLNRFFNLSYRLADPPPGMYAELLIEQAGFLRSGLAGDLAFLMSYLGFSLRQQQRCVTRLALILRIIGKGNQFDEPTIYATLLALREWRPKLYEQFLRADKATDDMLNALEEVNPDRWESARETSRIETRLIGMELDRRATMQDRAKPWVSPRLQYHLKRSSDVERSKKIYEEPQDYGKSFERPMRHGHWRRVLTILELGGKFQIQEGESG